MKLTVKTEPPKPVRLIKTFILELTEREAVYLRTLCNCISGGDYGPRGLFNKIGAELSRNGISNEGDLLVEPSKNDIRFVDKDGENDEE